MIIVPRLLEFPRSPSYTLSLLLARYFKQDSDIEIAARDTLVKGYIKLKLNTADGVPLDDEENPDAGVGEMTLEKVGRWRGVGRA